ncbi:MAG: hypothetical protein J2P43_07280 [Candidatus Dormibacteraeota bacterium]|nr:hypothetical protein [Candidatus Dormibacteraeota bacterium]
MNCPRQSSKAERRAARERVGAHHEAELAKLLAHVRASFDAYEAGSIDAFDLDGVIHHYHRAAQKLYSFCAGSASQVEVVARTLEWLESEGNERDWWEEAASNRRS